MCLITKRTQPSLLLVNTPDVLPPQSGPSTLRRCLCLQHRIFVDILDQIRDNFTGTGLVNCTLAGLYAFYGTDGAGSSEKGVALEVGSSGVFAVCFYKAAIEAVDADFGWLEREEDASLWLSGGEVVSELRDLWIFKANERNALSSRST